MNNKNLFKDIILNNASQALQFGSRWIFSIVLISVLTIEDFAVFSFVYSLSNILISVLPFGSSIFLISRNYEKETETNLLKNSISVVISLFLVIIFLYLVLSTFMYNVKGWGLSFYGILLSLFLSLNLVLFSFFKGLGKFKIEFYAYICFSVILLGFSAFLYFQEIINLRYIFWFLILLNLLVFIGTILFLSKADFFINNKYKISVKHIINEYKIRSYFGFQEIVSAIYTQIGMVLLFYILDETTYGYYRALFVIISPIFMITVAISQVLLNQLKKMQNQPIILHLFFRKAQYYTAVLGCFLMLFLFFTKDLIFNFINLERTSETIYSFYILLGIILMRFIFSNFEVLLVILDKQKQRFWVMFLSAVISILLIFILLPQFGLIGAISINAIAYFIVLIGLYLLASNYWKNKNPNVIV